MKAYSVNIDGVTYTREVMSNTGFIMRMKSEGLIKMNSKVTNLIIIK